MKSVLIFVAYFLGVGFATALGALLFISPQRFARVLEILNPASLWFRSGQESPVRSVTPPRLVGLVMFLMGMIMLIGPIVDMMSERQLESAPSQLSATRQSKLDLGELGGYIILLLCGLYLFVKPKAFISQSPEAVPQPEIFHGVRLFAALFMLVTLFLIGRMFWIMP